MNNQLKSACDGILQKVVTGKDRVPGVVAMITDRSANIYEGAAGERILGANQAMTTDTVGRATEWGGPTLESSGVDDEFKVRSSAETSGRDERASMPAHP